jgi:acyl-CoA thioesterase-1
MASDMQEVFTKLLKRRTVASLLLPLMVAGAGMQAASLHAETVRPANGAAAQAHSASKNLLVLGDSLSAEYGLTRGTGWVPLLEQRIRTAHIDAPIINASISGETTSGGMARLKALLEKHHPGIVLVELGANDALRGLSLNATESNLREIVDMARKSGARVVLLGMQIPPNYGGDYTRRFTGIYPKLAKETGATLVPFFLEGLQTRPDLFQADRIHPVASAQPLLLDNVWPHLSPLLLASAPGSHVKAGGKARAASAVTQ